jgi:cation/acetate symporter
MSVQILTDIIVGFTFAIYIGIALWAGVGTTKEL